MPTKTRSRSNESGWSSNSTGVVVGAAMAGAAVGLAANMGRKLFVQFAAGASGDWFDVLRTEHQMTLAIFDKIQATDDSQTAMRWHLLMKLKHALAKHAHEEENVIYPALRQENEREQADHLTSDHGYVKTYLYELESMDADNPAWLARVSDFRQMIEKHMREEEDKIFPKLRSTLSEEENRELTAKMNKEGLHLA